MEAVYAEVGGGLRVGEAPAPIPGPGQVRVRVVYGGICGSDLHYAEHGRNGIYTMTAPLILGHEIVGVIESLGSGIARPWAVGQQVAVHPATPTPQPGGEHGHGFHLAKGGSYLGSASTDPHTGGGFADYLVVGEEQLRSVPGDLSLRRAALAEPMAVAVHGVDRAGRDWAGKRVLVAGSGPIGCLAIAALRYRGAAQITATDLAQRPLDVARAVGADTTILLGRDPDPAPESFDVIIESSGSPRSLDSALGWIDRGGLIVQLGLLPAGPLGVGIAPLVSKEVTLVGSQRFDVELDEAIEVLRRTPQLDAVVTHIFDAADAVEAFAVARDAARSSKVLLRFGGDPAGGR